MSLAPRQQSILERAREQGYVSIDELAQAFAVTPQTIRRDINQLADQGLLRRTHGGAASVGSSIQNTAYAMREETLQHACPVCHKANHEPQAAFCSRCGNPLFTRETPPQA